MNFLKKNLFWISFLLLLFYVFAIFYRSDSSFDQDLGRHLKLGEIIVTTHSVPKTNLFSYTNPDFPFVNHHFLFGVIIYLWSLFFSLESFLYIKILIILAAVTLTLLAFRKTSSVLLLPIGYLFLHVLRERTDLRPEIFSFLFTALSLYILEKYYYAKKSKIIFLLPLIQFLWINIHIYFFLGFVLQGIYLIDTFISKEFQKFKSLLFIMCISISASLLNPNGFSGFFYPLSIFGNYGYTIAENQNIFLLESISFADHNFLFVKICSILIIFSLLISLLRKPLCIKDNLISFLGLVLAFINIRSFPYLFFLSLPFVLKTYNLLKLNRKSFVLYTIAAVFLVFESVLYLNGDYYRKIDSPVSNGIKLEENGRNALNFVLEKKLPQPIYNNFDIGSYIIYRGYPKYTVFVDGRPESYPADFFTKTYVPSQSDFSVFQSLDENYKFQTVIFSITDQTPWGLNFLRSIVKNKDWSTIYLDDFMIILAKTDQLKKMQITALDLSNLSSNNYNFKNYFSYLRIAYFLNNVGYQNSAKDFTKKALSLNPNSRIANSLMLYFLSNSNDFSEKSLIQGYQKKSMENFWW